MNTIIYIYICYYLLSSHWIRTFITPSVYTKPSKNRRRSTKHGNNINQRRVMNFPNSRQLCKEFEKDLAQNVKSDPKAFSRHCNSKLKNKPRIGDIKANSMWSGKGWYPEQLFRQCIHPWECGRYAIIRNYVLYVDPPLWWPNRCSVLRFPKGVRLSTTPEIPG